MNNIFSAKFINNINKNIKQYVTVDNSMIIILAMYITVLSIYTPRHIISLASKPLSKLLVLGSIIYYSVNNITLSIFISIAFILTINLENAISTMERNIDKNTFTENFKSKPSIKDGDKKKGNDEEDESDDESSSDSEDDSDSDYDDDSSGDSEEEFDANKLKPSKNLDDTFTKLHGAIHELENFISKEK